MCTIRNKLIVKFGSLFAGDKEARKAFRIKHMVTSPTVEMANYGKIYLPHYNQMAVYDPIEPEIYNRQGERIRTLFLRDIHSPHAPSMQGRYLFWDKYNFALKNHMYTHRSMLETMGSPDHRFGLLGETPSIVPFDYRMFDHYRGLEKDFDLIFTYDVRLLEKLPNARFLPYCARIKLDFQNIGISQALMRDDAYLQKSRNLSILSSHKAVARLHELRKEFAKYAKRHALCDTFGTFDGGSFVRPIDTLLPYRFSIVIENTLDECCFTEKLTNCFACQTIPVYIGAKGVKNYFNEDGIIRVDDLSIEGILKAIRNCTAEEYENRRIAILDNYRRVQAYLSIDDLMYQQYLYNVI